MIIAFQQTDSRDIAAVSSALGLRPDQARHLTVLPRQVYVGWLGPSCPGWQEPFLARTPRLETVTATDEEIAAESRAFTAQFDWKPLESRTQAGSSSRSEARFQEHLDAFMRDVLTQKSEYLYSPLTRRMERAGIRSAEMQAKVVKRAKDLGYITIAELSIHSRGGRPIKLLEGTMKGFAAYGVEWQPQGRGSLLTRAATHYVHVKLSRCPGWAVSREGDFHGKQCDLLALSKSGQAVAIEIASTPNHEPHNTLHTLRHGIAEHWAVCTSKRCADDVQRLFSQHLELADNPRLHVLTLAQALSEDWQPLGTGG